MSESMVEAWIPLRQAVAEVAAVYHEALKGDYGEARERAIEALQHRMELNGLDARAPSFGFQFKSGGKIVEKWTTPKGGKGMIPGTFWAVLATADCVRRNDWVAGEFVFSRNWHLLDQGDEKDAITEDFALSSAFGYAAEVEVSRRGLPLLDPSAIHFDNLLENELMSNRLPAISKALLNAWWTGLQNEVKQLTQDDLWSLCRAHFPNKSISRERIRELTGPRKRGPKPIRGEMTAK